jgi:pimeloyl-ACP methyl ester carboxylesterase
MKNAMTLARLAWSPRLYDRNLRKWLHRIDVPTLILWGRDDKLIPAAYGAAYRDLIPGARLQTLEGCGLEEHQKRIGFGKLIAMTSSAHFLMILRRRAWSFLLVR